MTNNIPSYKAILLGNTNVGKTSLIKKYMNQDKNTEATVSPNYVTSLLFGDQNFQFQIWDTAGQEAFDALNKLYYRDTSVAFFMTELDSNDERIDTLSSSN